MEFIKWRQWAGNDKLESIQWKHWAGFWNKDDEVDMRVEQSEWRQWSSDNGVRTMRWRLLEGQCEVSMRVDSISNECIQLKIL